MLLSSMLVSTDAAPPAAADAARKLALEMLLLLLLLLLRLWRHSNYAQPTQQALIQLRSFGISAATHLHQHLN